MTFRNKLVRHVLPFCLGLPAIAMGCSSNSCSGTIELLYIADDAVYVRPAGGVTGLTNCTPVSGVFVTLLKTNPNYASLYSALLAAYLAKEPASLRMTDGSSNCSIAYMTLP